MSPVYDFLADSARRAPDKPYVVDRGRVWTYGALLARTVSLAGVLGRRGVRAGDRVLLYLDNSAEYIAAFFAVLRLGAVVVPVNKNLTTEVVAFIAGDAEPALVLTNGIFKKRLAGGASALPLLDLDEPEDGVPPPAPPDGAVPDDEQPALILYTSGTTRMPKGVVLTQRNLMANTASIVSYLGLTARDSLLAVVSFCYSYGNSLLLTHTMAGGTLFIENRTAYPATILAQLSETGANGFSTVGSYLNLLLKQEALTPEHFQGLRYVTFAGESVSFDDIDRLLALAPSLKVYVMYGQTEASARLSYLDPGMLREKRGSVGKSIPGVTLRVVNEQGADAAPGEVGEIIAAGDSIMRGYWRNDDATREVLRGGWLHTGDLGTVDEDGYLYIKGRNDDMIKFMGHRISPAEIEAAVNSFADVLESAAVAVTVGGQTQIKAFVVPKTSAVDLTALQTHLRKLLPPFKNPSLYAVIDALPRTATGKIRRSDLKNSP